MKLLNISLLQVGLEHTIHRVYGLTLVPLSHDWPLINHKFHKIGLLSDGVSTAISDTFYNMSLMHQKGYPHIHQLLIGMNIAPPNHSNLKECLCIL